MNFVLGRVNVDVDILRGDLQGHVDERVRSLGQVGAVDHLDALLERLGLNQSVVDEQEQIHSTEWADVHVRNQAFGGECESLRKEIIKNSALNLSKVIFVTYTGEKNS